MNPYLKNTLVTMFILIITLQYSHSLTLVSLEFPPYIYTKNNIIQGITVDILNEVTRRSNIKFDIKIYPWSRSLLLAKSNIVNGIFPILKTKERSSFLIYTDALAKEELVLFARNKNIINYDGNINSLRKYTIGRVKNFSSGPEIDKAIKDQIITKVQETSSSKQNIIKLLEKRFDILIDTKYVVLFYLHSLKRQNELKELKPVIQTTFSYLAFTTKTDYSIIKKYNDTLKKMKQDGTYDKIVLNYLKTLNVKKIR